MKLANSEQKVLSAIRRNPFASLQELANLLGVEPTTIGAHISRLKAKGALLGRAYQFPQSPTITCIGAANVDRSLRTFGPAVMETSNPARATDARGGVARNVAENLARLGVTTRLVSAVGRDAAGEAILSETSDAGVNIDGVLLDTEHATGSYTAIFGAEGNLVIGLADMDINAALTPAVIRQHWGHIAASAFVFADANGSPEMLEDLLSRCRKNGVRLAFDAVSIPKATRLPRNLTGCEILFCNAAEARAISGAGVGDDPLSLASELLTRGTATAIITDGAGGLACANQSGEAFELPASATELVDATGAGDALIAATLSALIDDESLPSACQRGLTLAAQVAGVAERFISPQLAEGGTA